MNLSAQYRLGVLLVTLSTIVWSSAGFFARLTTVDTPTMLLWRGLFGSMGFFAYLLFVERGNTLRRLLGMGLHSLAYALVAVAAMQMFIASFRFTSVAHVSIIYAVVPFVAGGLAWLALGERPSKTAIASAAVAIGGVIVMVGLGRGEGHYSGDLLALGMTVTMAALIIIGRKYLGIDMLASACLSTLLSAVVSLPFASHTLPPAAQLSILAAFGILSQAVGFVLFAYGSRLISAAETALIGALDAPLAPIWVWLFFNEVPLSATLIGGFIVFIAVMAHFYVQFSHENKTLAAAQ